MKLVKLTPVVFFALLLSCGGKEKNAENTVPNVPVIKNGLKIAYYVQDSLQENYVYFKKIEKEIEGKQKKLEAELKRRQESLQSYVQTNTEKDRQGLLSDRDREVIGAEAQQREQAIYQYQQTEGSRLQEEANEILEVINNRIKAAAKKYCEKHQIDLLLVDGQGGQMAYVSEKMDATKEFVAFVNQFQEEIEKDLKSGGKNK